MTVRRMSAHRPEKGLGSASVHAMPETEIEAGCGDRSSPKAEVVSSNLAGCANPSNSLADKSKNTEPATSAECRRIGFAERSSSPFDGLSVYDGRTLLGTTFDLGCRYAAQLADGTDLGTFPNLEAARGAILAASATRA